MQDLQIESAVYRALVRAGPSHCVAVVHELLPLEGPPRLPRRPLQDDHRKRPHQVRPVRLLLEIVPAIMVDLRLLVGRVLEKLVELDAEGVGESEVEGAEIFEEGLVHKLLGDGLGGYRVDAEVVGLFLTLRGLVVAHPV